MTEKTEKFLDAIKDRITSPTTGTFTLLWLIINWKILIILAYGKESFAEKIKHIESYLLINKCLWEPLCWTVFLLALLPLLKSIHSHWILFVETFVHKQKLLVDEKKYIRENESKRRLGEIDQYGTFLPAMCHTLKEKLSTSSRILGNALDFLDNPSQTMPKDNLHALRSTLLEHQLYEKKVAPYFNSYGDVGDREIREIKEGHDVLERHASNDAKKKIKVMTRVIVFLIIFCLILMLLISSIYYR